MFIVAARVSDIAPGGMAAANAAGRELVICNYEGNFYALDRQCGHMKARLETGTLEGYILTCPLHFAQFDIRTGEALSGPVPDYSGKLPQPVATHDIKSYRARVEGMTVMVWIEGKNQSA